MASAGRSPLASDPLESTKVFVGGSLSPRVTYSTIDQTNLKARGMPPSQSATSSHSPLHVSQSAGGHSSLQHSPTGSTPSSRVAAIDNALSHFKHSNATAAGNRHRTAGTLPSSPSTRAGNSLGNKSSSTRQGSDSPMRSAIPNFMAPTASASTRNTAISEAANTNTPQQSRKNSPSRKAPATFNPSGNHRDTPNVQVQTVRAALLKATTSSSATGGSSQSPTSQQHASSRSPQDITPWDPTHNHKRLSVLNTSVFGSSSVISNPTHGRPLFPTAKSVKDSSSKSPIRGVGADSRLLSANSISPVARESSLTLNADFWRNGDTTDSITARAVAPIDFFDASGYMRRVAASGDLFSHCGFTSNSREGRILTLVKNFQQSSLFRWHRRVKEIANRSNRSAYLNGDDAKFLENVLARNIAFMRNLESIIAEAATGSSGGNSHQQQSGGAAPVPSSEVMDCGVIRFAYAAFEQSTQFNNAINLLLVGNAPQLKQLQKDREGAEEAIAERQAYMAGSGVGSQNTNSRSPQRRRSTTAAELPAVSPASSLIQSPSAALNVASTRIVVNSSQVAAAMRSLNAAGGGTKDYLMEFKQDGLDDGAGDTGSLAHPKTSLGGDEATNIPDFPAATPPDSPPHKDMHLNPTHLKAFNGSVVSDVPSLGPSAFGEFFGTSFIGAAGGSAMLTPSTSNTHYHASDNASGPTDSAVSPSRQRGTSLPPALPVSSVSRGGDPSSTAAALWRVGGAGAFIGGGGRLVTAEESRAFKPDGDDDNGSLLVGAPSSSPQAVQTNTMSASNLGTSNSFASRSALAINNLSSPSRGNNAPAASTNTAYRQLLAAAVAKAQTRDESLATALASAPVEGTALASSDIIMYMGSKAVGGAAPPNIRFDDKGLPVIGVATNANISSDGVPTPAGHPQSPSPVAAGSSDAAVFTEYLSRIERKRQEELYQPLHPQTTSVHRDPSGHVKAPTVTTASSHRNDSVELQSHPINPNSVISRQPHYMKPLQRPSSPIPSGPRSLLSVAERAAESRSPSRRNSPTRVANASTPTIYNNSPNSLHLVSASSGFRPPHLPYMNRSELASRGLHNVYERGGSGRGQSPTTYEVVSNNCHQHPNSLTKPNIVYDFTGATSSSAAASAANSFAHKRPQQQTYSQTSTPQQLYNRSLSGASNQSPQPRQVNSRSSTPPRFASSSHQGDQQIYDGWEYSAAPVAAKHHQASAVPAGGGTSNQATANAAPPIVLDRARRMALLEYIEVLTLKRNGILPSATPPSHHQRLNRPDGGEDSNKNASETQGSSSSLSEKEIKSAHNAFLEMYGDRDGNRQFYAWLAAAGTRR